MTPSLIEVPKLSQKVANASESSFLIMSKAFHRKTVVEGCVIGISVKKQNVFFFKESLVSFTTVQASS